MCHIIKPQLQFVSAGTRAPLFHAQRTPAWLCTVPKLRLFVQSQCVLPPPPGCAKQTGCVLRTIYNALHCQCSNTLPPTRAPRQQLSLVMARCANDTGYIYYRCAALRCVCNGSTDHTAVVCFFLTSCLWSRSVCAWQDPANIEIAFDLLGILIVRYRLNRGDEVLVGSSAASPIFPLPHAPYRDPSQSCHHVPLLRLLASQQR